MSELNSRAELQLLEKTVEDLVKKNQRLESAKDHLEQLLQDQSRTEESEIKAHC